MIPPIVGKNAVGYSSHLEILDFVFKNVKVKTVFEFGCGLYSTNFFVDNAKKVTSVEMQSEDWYNKVKSEIKSRKLDISYKPGPQDAITSFVASDKKYDLVFVDGHEASRIDCVNASFDKATTMVIHDTNDFFIRHMFRAINFKNDFQFINIRKNYPATGVFTNNKVLIDRLKENFKDGWEMYRVRGKSGKIMTLNSKSEVVQ